MVNHNNITSLILYLNCYLGSLVTYDRRRTLAHHRIPKKIEKCKEHITKYFTPIGGHSKFHKI